MCLSQSSLTTRTSTSSVYNHHHRRRLIIRSMPSYSANYAYSCVSKRITQTAGKRQQPAVTDIVFLSQACVMYRTHSDRSGSWVSEAQQARPTVSQRHWYVTESLPRQQQQQQVRRRPQRQTLTTLEWFAAVVSRYKLRLFRNPSSLFTVGAPSPHVSWSVNRN